MNPHKLHTLTTRTGISAVCECKQWSIETIGHGEQERRTVAHGHREHLARVTSAVTL